MRYQLDQIIPFTFLTPDLRRSVEAGLEPRGFAAGAVMVQAGQVEPGQLFLLSEGCVEMLDPATGRCIQVVEAGNTFGERGCLFGEPSRYEVRALEPVRCWVMEAAAYQQLLAASPVFRRAQGQILREQQGLFDALDRFLAEVQHGVSKGRLDMSALVARYQDLVPALHPKISSARLDLAGLMYALPRLPDNLGRTFHWFLADELSALYGQPERDFLPISTPARRRSVYEMMPGKNLVLLRDGLSDLLDFISCLCLFIVEARKIRYQIGRPDMLVQLRSLVAREAELGSSALEGLPFTAEERRGLMTLWPRHAAARIRDIAVHHEDFSTTIWKAVGDFNQGQAERWTTQLAHATQELLGIAPSALPPDLRVHIISSNTHSVTNCLSTWLAGEADAIEAWAHRVGHPVLASDWLSRFDLLVALSRDYLQAHPGAARARQEAEARGGRLVLGETACTGIQVELFDTASLRDQAMDPALDPVPADKRALLVNIDYAFGEQATGIISNLIQLFGRNLDSVNVLGKAGGILGKRGDVLVPTAFVHQRSEQFMGLDNRLDLAALRAALPDRGVHHGPLLTVAGTLLQNRVLLRFYQHIWECIGLEMEGSWYHRPLQEAGQLGLVGPNLVTRTAYYVSDLPLEHGSTLSASMRAVEGIPPLYAITRVILNGIFAQERRR